MLHDQRQDTEDLIRADFERKRLALFAHHGFEAVSTWHTDPQGRRTYAMEGGNGDCPKILIHGGLSEGSEWFPLAGRLDGRVVIADRPGCGLTYVPAARRQTFRRDMTRWVADLVESLNVPQVDLIGNSLGGYISLVFAMAYPKRVRRLVLVGAPAGIHPGVPLFVRLWGSPVLGRLIGRLGIKDIDQMRALADRILVSDARRIPPESLEMMVAGSYLPGVAEYSHRMLRQLTNLGGVRRGLLIDSEIENLEVPTSFVWGEEDAFTDPTAVNRVWDRMPRAEASLIADAGHLPHLDQPDVVAKAVQTFLDQDSE